MGITDKTALKYHCYVIYCSAVVQFFNFMLLLRCNASDTLNPSMQCKKIIEKIRKLCLKKEKAILENAAHYYLCVLIRLKYDCCDSHFPLIVVVW